jgi:hypothetical protein
LEVRWASRIAAHQAVVAEYPDVAWLGGWLDWRLWNFVFDHVGLTVGAQLLEAEGRGIPAGLVQLPEGGLEDRLVPCRELGGAVVG